MDKIRMNKTVESEMASEKDIVENRESAQENDPIDFLQNGVKDVTRRVLSKAGLVTVFFAGLRMGDTSLEDVVNVLETPAVSSSLLLICGLYMTWIMIMGTLETAKEGDKLKGYTSLWLPIRTAMITAFLIPNDVGVSSLMSSLSWLAKMVWAA